MLAHADDKGKHMPKYPAPFEPEPSAEVIAERRRIGDLAGRLLDELIETRDKTPPLSSARKAIGDCAAKVAALAKQIRTGK